MNGSPGRSRTYVASPDSKSGGPCRQTNRGSTDAGHQPTHPALRLGVLVERIEDAAARPPVAFGGDRPSHAVLRPGACPRSGARPPPSAGAVAPTVPGRPARDRVVKQFDDGDSLARLARVRRWPRGTITYVDATRDRGAVKRAVRFWNDSGVDVRFQKIKNKRRADLVIRNSRRVPGGCGTGLATLGYTGRRQAFVNILHGSDADGQTCAEPGQTLVMTHELGHVLGLGHDDSKCSIMNSYHVNGVAPSQCFTPESPTSTRPLGVGAAAVRRRATSSGSSGCTAARSRCARRSGATSCRGCRPPAWSPPPRRSSSSIGPAGSRSAAPDAGAGAARLSPRPARQPRYDVHLRRRTRARRWLGTSRTTIAYRPGPRRRVSTSPGHRLRPARAALLQRVRAGQPGPVLRRCVLGARAGSLASFRVSARPSAP